VSGWRAAAFLRTSRMARTVDSTVRSSAPPTSGTMNGRVRGEKTADERYLRTSCS